MPIYEYVCKNCGHKFEMLMGFKDKDDDLVCPNCKAVKPEKIFSVFASVDSTGSGGHSHTCSPGG